ncbi:MAG: Rho termination factor N-terminal domain-containing protein [Bacteroidota bacterium]
MTLPINTDRIAEHAGRLYNSARRDIERAYDNAADSVGRTYSTVIVKSDTSWAPVAAGTALVAGLAIGGFYVFWRKTQEANALAQTNYEDWTREQLYNRARQEEVEGRSTMNKSELIDALRTEVSAN